VRAGGFTLVEVVMTIGLIVLIFGLMVIGVTGWEDRHRLDEGSRQFETLLCMARADAAANGRKLRIAFYPGTSGTMEAEVFRESDPLGSPGEFVPYDSCPWLHYIPSGLVDVVSSVRTGPSMYEWPDSSEEQAAGENFQSITFYPDGSSDWMEVQLASTSPDDPRRAVIRVDGTTGVITRTLQQAESPGGG